MQLRANFIRSRAADAGQGPGSGGRHQPAEGSRKPNTGRPASHLDRGEGQEGGRFDPPVPQKWKADAVVTLVPPLMTVS